MHGKERKKEEKRKGRMKERKKEKKKKKGKTQQQLSHTAHTANRFQFGLQDSAVRQRGTDARYMDS